MDGRAKNRNACDACKRMKVKCEWEQDEVCNRCSAHRTRCIVTIKDRKKREKKEGSHLSRLEDRLQRMERAMTQSGLDLDSNERRRAAEDIDTQGGINDKLSLLKIQSDGSTAFVGASSGFSIFSPSGLKWISEITGDDDFQKWIFNILDHDDHSEKISNPSMFHTMSDAEREPLPSQDIADLLVQSFFDGFNRTFPLYNREAFETRLCKKYPVTSSDDIAWYASVNTVLAIGWLLYPINGKGSSPQPASPQPASPKQKDIQNQSWWKWFHNAGSAYVDLEFKEGSLLAVQALVGMTFILQTLPNPFPCSVMAASALRVAQSIGLHRNIREGFGLTPADVEERRNVFWIAFVAEGSIIHRSGRPSVIHEDDIGVNLPKNVKLTKEILDQPQPFQCLRIMSTLAILQGRVYNKLFSAKSLTKSKWERLRWIGLLDEELQFWKDSIPIEIRPGHEVKCHEYHVIGVLMLQFGYFSTLSTIHRASLPYGFSGGDDILLESDGAESQLNPRVFASGAIRVSAARSTIDLLKICQSPNVIHTTEINIIRMVDSYPLAASLTLFANILQNPRDPQALSDIELMKSVTTFLSGFFDDKTFPESDFVVKVFLEVNRRAAQHVEKARMQGTQVLKRARSETIPIPSGSVENSELINPATPATPASVLQSNANQPLSVYPIASTSSPPYGNTESRTTFTPSATKQTPLPTTQYLSSQAPLAPNTNFQPYQQQDEAPIPPQTDYIGNDPYATYDPEMMDPMNALMPQDGSWFLPIWGPGSSNETWGGLDWPQSVDGNDALGGQRDDGMSGQQ